MGDRMKLEVGKKYMNQFGFEVQIWGMRKFLFIRRFFGTDGHKYKRNGKHCRYRQSMYSLVSEVKK
jgi:hypothetical protein